MSNEKDSKDTPKELPVYGPALQIVPHEEKSDEENVVEERKIIEDLFEENVKLPWINPPRESKRGQA